VQVTFTDCFVLQLRLYCPPKISEILIYKCPYMSVYVNLLQKQYLCQKILKLKALLFLDKLIHLHDMNDTKIVFLDST
jgi:hypothetical protein